MPLALLLFGMLLPVPMPVKVVICEFSDAGASYRYSSKLPISVPVQVGLKFSGAGSEAYTGTLDTGAYFVDGTGSPWNS